jgi:uncharacterized protein involved in response to NO
LRASPWRPTRLLWAPHRLGFFLAMALLLGSGLWWTVVQLDRVGWGPGLGYTVSPSLTHAAIMTFGFMPLFFAGFLFTAGPKWLGVAAPTARQIGWALALQFVGWWLWLAGTHGHVGLAWTGVALAVVGLAGMYARFWQLVRASTATDRVHALAVGIAGAVGVLSLATMGVAAFLGEGAWAMAAVKTGLWGCVVVTFVAVLHRMLPFFTSSALPLIQAWRPLWVFWFLLGVVAVELLGVWHELWVAVRADEHTPHHGWMLLQGLAELGSGSVVVWLAVAWGLVQSLKVRLLAMLHLGFLWMGLSLLLSGASQLLGLRLGVPVLGLGALHAMTMGCLGSLLLAMVTRVSCGHSGRPLIADNLIWSLFWLLQGAVVLRIASALPGVSTWGLALTAVLWTGVMTTWGLRLMRWYGQPRADGRTD